MNARLWADGVRRRCGVSRRVCLRGSDLSIPDTVGTNGTCMRADLLVRILLPFEGFGKGKPSHRLTRIVSGTSRPTLSAHTSAIAHRESYERLQHEGVRGGAISARSVCIG